MLALQETDIRALLTQAAKYLGAATQKSFSANGEKLECGQTQGDSDLIFDALLTQKNEQRKFNETIHGIETVRQAQDALLKIRQAQAQHLAFLHQQCMARLCRGLLADFSELKRERGWVDMNDLELTANQLMSESATFSSTSFKTPTPCNGKLWQRGFQAMPARGMRLRFLWWETPSKVFTAFVGQSRRCFRRPKISLKTPMGSAEPCWPVTIPIETRNRSLL
jgi:hypothetical protein